jgi:hypothetical protein
MISRSGEVLEVRCEMGYKDLNEEYETAMDLVEYILDEYPETRDSDTKLIQKIFEEQTGIVIPIEEANMPALRTLTRARQTIQNEHEKFLPDDEVQEKRDEREEEFRKETQKQKKSDGQIFP